MLKGLLGRVASPIQESYQSGTLLGGGGLIGGLLGPEARREAQSRAIIDLGARLMGQAPSRTPVSFGQALGSGLLGARGAYEKDLAQQLGQAATLKSLTKPDFIKIKDEDGREVLYNPATGKMLDPFAATAVAPMAAAPVNGETVGLGGTLTPEERQEAPTVSQAAQGDVSGGLTAAARKGLGLLGIEVGGEAAKARDYVFNTNKEMQVALTKDLGGRFTKVVADTIKEIMPTPNMVDADFRSKATQLVRFSNERIAEVKAKMPSLNRKEKKEAQSYIDEVARQVRKYEAMLSKNSVAPQSSAISGMSSEALRARAGLSGL